MAVGINPGDVATPSSEEHCIAGGPDDFMTVRHLVLTGTQREIGQCLADVARRESNWHPAHAQDLRRNRMRRRWFEQHWPEQYLRMAGVATVYGEKIEDDQLDFSYVMAEPGAPQCSAVWCSAAISYDGHSRVGRNLDFTTRTISELFGRDPVAHEPAVFARPYVIETHPDGGSASIVTTIGDLLGCLDGINEHGLVVALLADDEPSERRPSGIPQAGLNEMQLARYLLDRCANTEEALELLYSTKQYEEWAVAHYLVADRDSAFVWERELHNVEHAVIFEGDGLCVTNYLLYRQGVNVVPEDVSDNPGLNDAFRRARTLQAGFNGQVVSEEDLWSMLESVRADQANDSWQGENRVRTLWHNQFDQVGLTIEYEFYLGDREDGKPRRSSPVTLTLSH